MAHLNMVKLLLVKLQANKFGINDSFIETKKGKKDIEN